MKNKQNVLLVDCKAESVLSFAQELNINNQQVVIKEHVANWKRTGKLSELRRYWRYFAVGIRYFIKRKQFSAIVGWQQFYALIFCFCCSIFHVKKTNTVIALNYTYKEKCGKMAALYRWFMGRCMDIKYLDYLHVPSRQYAIQIEKEFGFPIDRIIVTTFGVNDEKDEMCCLPPPEDYVKDGYALAIGRSNRDYDFLVRAWKNVDFPLVIISDTYYGKADTDNIAIINNVAGAQSYPWIANCGLMIIPIDDGTICSGDTVLLTAMSLERKIIVTSPSTLAEMYVADGENAVLCEKNEEKMCAAVACVLHSEQYRELGARARKSFLDNYSRQSMGRKTLEILNASEHLKALM